MADVSTPSPGYEAAIDDWRQCQIIKGGTKLLRHHAAVYLPQYPAEARHDYDRRIQATTLTNVYGTTIKRLSSTPFAVPISFSPDADDRIVGDDSTHSGWADNVDNKGTSATTFGRDLLDDLVTFGVCHILVDSPMVPAGTTLRQKADMRIRPTMKRVSPPDLFAWRVEHFGGQPITTEIRIHETVAEQLGPYGEKVIQQIRVIAPSEVQIWRKKEGDELRAATAGGSEWRLHDSHALLIPQGPAQVPLISVYANFTGPFTARPPLIDLCDLNLKHVNIDSDLQRILHVNCTPIMIATGFGPLELEGMEIAPNTFIKAIDPSASVKFVEHSGASIKLIQDNMESVKVDMGNLALEVLTRSLGGPATATEKIITTAEETAELQEIVRNLENGFDQAWQLMAAWDGDADYLDIEAGTNINNDFGLVFRNDTDLGHLKDARKMGDISRETFLEEMKARGILRETLDIGEELGRIAEEDKATTPFDRPFETLPAIVEQVTPEPPPSTQDPAKKQISA